jgi:hypothetical protein
MRTFLAMAVLLFTCVLAGAQDFQSWNEADLTATWHRVDFLVPLLARTDSSLPNPQLAAAGVTADFPVQRHLIVTAGYLFADLPQKSIQVHLPLVAITPSIRVGRITLADRNRFEKLFQYANQPVRYRNRILFDERLGRQSTWHMFVENETIWDVTDAVWIQNRFQVGGGLRTNGRLSLDLYYLRRNASGGAVPTNVLGTTLRIALTSKLQER